VSKASGGVEKEAIFDFDFTKEPYEGGSRESVQSAILKAYWKPHLAIKRSTGGNDFMICEEPLLLSGRVMRN
jgi:hypothetical protein